MQSVSVPGIGDLEFPDEMSQEEMASAIQKNFPQIHSSPAKKTVSVPADIPKKESGIGAVGAIGKGFERGFQQVTGGMAQRGAEFSQYSANVAADDLANKMQSGEIPATQENIDKLDKLQTQAVKAAQLLSGAEVGERQRREDYAPIEEAQPVASFLGNIGGQMAGLPIPGIGQARLPVQIGKGIIEGALSGYAQQTVGDESATNNAGIGTALGGAAPAVLKPVASGIGAAYRGIAGKASPELAKVISNADSQGLPLLTSDVVRPDTFGKKSIQQLGEKIPLVGTGGVRADQQAARVGEVKKLAEEYGIANDDEIVASIKRKTDKLTKAAGDRYQQTIVAMGDSPINLSRTAKVVDDQIDKYTKPGAVQNPAVIKALEDFKAQITSGDNSLELLRQNRTLFRELIKGESGIASESGQRANDAVYDAITSDMKAGVASKLGNDAAREMSQADSIWAREAQAIKNTKLKNIFSKGDIKPEEATKMLFSADKSEAKTLYDSLDTVGRQNARAAIINRAFEKSKESPEKFISEMDRLKNQTGTFFRGEDRRILEGTINYLKYTQQASKASVATKSGQELFAAGALGAAGADIATTGGLGTAGFASLGLAARAYESKPVRNLMVRMASIKPGTTQFEKTAEMLTDQLSKAAPRAETARKEDKK